jgi:hypothetical protein
MNIVREYMPNGMPMLIQGVLNEDNIVDTATVRVHPLTNEGKVLFELKIPADDSFIIATADRLTDLYAVKNN